MSDKKKDKEKKKSKKAKIKPKAKAKVGAKIKPKAKSKAEGKGISKAKSTTAASARSADPKGSLADLHCTGCKKRCPLNEPRCKKGRAQAEDFLKSSK